MAIVLAFEADKTHVHGNDTSPDDETSYACLPYRNNVGLMLKATRLAEASKESEIRMRFVRDIAAPLLARALGSQRVWVFGSASTNLSRSDSDVDILVEGGRPLCLRAAVHRIRHYLKSGCALWLRCGCFDGR